MGLACRDVQGRWFPGWHGEHGKIMDSWRELEGLKKCVQLEGECRSSHPFLCHACNVQDFPVSRKKIP